MGAIKILFSGKPGIGKTTAALAVAKLIGRSKIAGFFTQEIRNDSGERVGFTIEDFSGNIAIMAKKGFKSFCRVGSYGVDISAIEKIAIPSIERGIAEKKFIIIDEIGKMELFSEKFVRCVYETLTKNCSVLATITSRPNPVADDIKRVPGIEIIEITRMNRNIIPQIVYQKILKYL
ncbi:MAG: NTPase [Promethearchaeota archaeon]